MKLRVCILGVLCWVALFAFFAQSTAQVVPAPAGQPPVPAAVEPDGLLMQLQSFSLLMEDSIVEELRKAATPVKTESKVFEAFDIASDDLFRIVGESWGKPEILSRDSRYINYANAQMAENAPEFEQPVNLNCYAQMRDGQNGFSAQVYAYGRTRLTFLDDSVKLDLHSDNVNINANAFNGNRRNRNAQQPSLQFKGEIKVTRALIFIARLGEFPPHKPTCVAVFNVVRATEKRMPYVEMLRDLGHWMQEGKPGVKRVIDEAIAWENLVTPPDAKSLEPFKKELSPGIDATVIRVSIPRDHPFQIWDPTGRPVRADYIDYDMRAEGPVVRAMVGSKERQNIISVPGKPDANGKLTAEFWASTGPWTYVGDIDEEQPLKKGNRSFRIHDIQYYDGPYGKKMANCSLQSQNAADLDVTAVAVDTDGKEYFSQQSLVQLRSDVPQAQGNRGYWIGQIELGKDTVVDHFAVKTRPFQKVTFENIAAAADMNLAAKAGQASGAAPAEGVEEKIKFDPGSPEEMMNKIADAIEAGNRDEALKYIQLSESPYAKMMIMQLDLFCSQARISIAAKEKFGAPADRVIKSMRNEMQSAMRMIRRAKWNVSGDKAEPINSENSHMEGTAVRVDGTWKIELPVPPPEAQAAMEKQAPAMQHTLNEFEKVEADLKAGEIKDVATLKTRLTAARSPVAEPPAVQP